MNILVTGAGSKYGNAWADMLSEDHSVTCIGVEEHPDLRTVVADRTDYKSVRPIVDGQDVIIDLPIGGDPNAPWDVHAKSITGTYTLLEAAREAEVQKYILGSSNKTVEGYEVENSPELYEPSCDLVIDHTSTPRPMTIYGVSRLFSEHLGSMYVNSTEWSVGIHEVLERRYPKQFYVVRWGSMRFGKYDHPFGDAERGVEEGRWDRGSEEYKMAVKRMRCTWISNRDLRQLLQRILKDTDVDFDIFYGVSDNDRRWLDIEHARDVLGYEPKDNSAAWEAPPE